MKTLFGSGVLSIGRLVWVGALWALSQPVMGQVAVTDDAGSLIKLSGPAKRIVSLSPHLTELLFAAGAGSKLVGVMEGSDYPLEARALPRVGSAAALNLEAVLSLQPDLVVAWQSGNPPAQIAKLKALKVPVFLSEPKALMDIPSSLERLGTLAGTQAQAKLASAALEKRIAALPRPGAHTPPLRVFYQIWSSPLMSINNAHIISDVLRICGAENIFGQAETLSPIVSKEAVLAANPEVIISSPASATDWRAPWRAWPTLAATARDTFCEVNPDWMSRAGPRLIEGAHALCSCLETARLKRPAVAPPTPPR